ncbi:MAG: DUF4124 domain-containing protein [Gammaproteobacteria bacterium]
MQNLTLNTLLTLLFCASFQGFAEVYKWVDANGQTHYGEKPGAGDATVIEIQDVPTADTGIQQQNEEREKLLKVYEEERNTRNEEKRRADEESRKIREKCLVAENELKDLQQGGLKFYDIDEKGERKYLSDKELDQRIQTLKEQYNRHCK